MKTLKYLVSAAMVITMHGPLAVSPAFATIVPSSTTTGTMESTCLADLGANSGVLLHDGSPAFTTEVVALGQVDGPTTEVPLSRVETPGSRHGTGTPTYSVLSIVGDPYRVGGSVNMFGLQGAKNKNWPGSEYDFTADYSTTTTISYQCEVTEHTETYNPPVHIPGSPVEGYYINCDFGHGQGNDNSGTCDEVGQPQGSCAAHTAQGPSFPRWGLDTEQCKFIKTKDAVDPVDIEESWDAGPDVARADLLTSHNVDETNIAEDVPGHEVNGGPWTEVAPAGTLWNAAQVVICISPKKLPGIWTQQNGYLGSKCTTSWFNVAPWGAGTSTSQGTYISVPGA